MRILLNQTPSPDGARGVFLLLPQDWVWEEPTQNPTNLEERLRRLLYLKNQDLTEILEIKRTLEELARKGDILRREANIQHAFERHTERWLDRLDLFYTRPSREEMSNFDFLIQSGNESLCLEVKSDRHRYTGNISLELIRDYKRDFTSPLNAGSLVKTQASLWQVYYYDCEQRQFDAKVFRVPKLLERASHVLKHIWKQKCT